MPSVSRPLTTEELNGLRSIGALDGQAKVPLDVRHRLALYRMIEETAKGWHLTRLGRERIELEAGGPID